MMFSLSVGHLSRSLLLSGGLLLGVLLTGSAAQVPTAIRPDGTLGTTVSQNGTVYNITGGTRPGNGPNLFHSFDRFSVGTNDTARFSASGSPGIQNILSRVTGGQQSLIDGHLQSTISGANLYLLNPSGVLFGPNASLDISGSFHISTADYLRLADGATFSTHLGAQSTLTVAPPAAFGFLGNTPAPITIQSSTLTVSENKAMSVVGGNIQIVGGKLVAPSGRIQIASVASPGEVIFSPLELAPDLQVDAFPHLGRLEISQGALLNASGVGVAGGGGPGGAILIRSGRLLVDGSSVLVNTLGNVHGASLGLDLQVAADAVIANDSDLRVSPFAAGNGGDIRVNVGRLTLANGSRLLTSSFGTGHGGTLSVAASDSISISGRGNRDLKSGLFSNTFGRGNGGRVFVSTPVLTITDGNIQGGTNGGSRGHAGGADVRVKRLTLTEGAQIDGTTRGAGRGGQMTVVATESITITGLDSEGSPSGLFSNSDGSSGDAGHLLVSAPLLSMDGGLISTRTRGDGNAGEIEIQTGQLTLSGGAQIASTTFSKGRGGRLTVVATESITIGGPGGEGIGPGGGPVVIQSGLFNNADSSGDAGPLFVSTPLLSLDGGRIVSRTLGEGNAGALEIQTGRLTLTSGGQIFSGIGTFEGNKVIGTNGPGRGGTVTVRATDSIFIAGRGQGDFRSAIASNAQIGRGRAGDVVIATPSLEMRDGFISTGTSALATGEAGNIVLEVGRLTLTGGAQISTSTSGAGHGGDLSVVATEAISITGRGSELLQTGLFSIANASGDAGHLFVSAPRLEVVGGRILTRTLGESNAGDLEVQVGRLTLTEGGQIFSGTGFFSNDGIIGTQGPGRGGNLTVVATEAVSIAGADSHGFRSGLFSSAQIGRGSAGNLSLSTPTLTMMDGGRIAADTLSTSTGNAGNIEVRVGRLTLTGRAQISTSSFGSGRGGNVAVTAAEQIELSTSGAISASSTGQGDAGNIVLQAGQLFQSRNGVVTTEAETADGGNITLTAGALVELHDSQLTATVKSGVGKGGNITIDPQFVVLQRSQVRADAFGGPGGNVRLVAEVFLADPVSQVSASSALGITGTVDIRAPVTNLSGVVAPLSPDFARATALLQDRCAARLREGTVSTFVVRGRPSPSASYDHPLPSRVYTPQRPRPTPAGEGSLLVEPLAAPQGLLPEDPAGRVQETSAWALPGSSLVLALPCAR